MKVSGERYFPRIENRGPSRFDSFIAYEHWHRYRYAAPFVVGKSVLDIASGEGYGSAFLANHATLVYGVDISEEAVQHSRRMYVRDNLHFLRGSADAIPITDHHCFDVIVSFETIEHLDAPTQELFGSEIKRLLKHDGILLISTPNRSIYTETNKYQNPYHLNEYSEEEFLRYLKNYFKNVLIFNQHVYPASHIWNPGGMRGPVAEYQMAFDDGEFRPVEGDGKEAVYLVAVCADRGELAVGPDSLLVDLTEVAFGEVPGRVRAQMASLFLDTGEGFRAEEVVREETEYRPEFTLKYPLDPTTPIRQLRWDPLEGRLCHVRIHQVLREDGDGLISRVDLSGVTSNGLQRDEATFQFDTLDPMIFLPVAGSVASITIEGECVAADEPHTLAGLEQAVQSRSHQLALKDHELLVARQQLAASEQSAEAYRHQLARQDHELLVARQQLAVLVQSVETFRGLLSQQDNDLEAARQRLAAHERSIVARTEQLQNSEQLIQSYEQRMHDLEGGRAELEARLQAILHSKRWIVINWFRSVLYFLPDRFRSSWTRVRGKRRDGDRRSPEDTRRRRSIPDRIPVRHSRSGQGSLNQ